MGATVFMDSGTGKDVYEAFQKAVQQACYDNGHSGYTGTIAEKPGYVLIERPPRANALDVLNALQGAYYAEALLMGEKHKGWKRDPRAEKAWKRLVEWYGEAKARQYVRVFDSKWDECIAVEASPAETKKYKQQYGVGHIYSYKDGKTVVTVKKVRNFHLFYFGGWASC